MMLCASETLGVLAVDASGVAERLADMRKRMPASPLKSAPDSSGGTAWAPTVSNEPEASPATAAALRDRTWTRLRQAPP